MEWGNVDERVEASTLRLGLNSGIGCHWWTGDNKAGHKEEEGEGEGSEAKGKRNGKRVIERAQ